MKAKVPVKIAQPAAAAVHRVGYARVSTDDQNLALQRDALQNAGCFVIYEEHASAGATRPELANCLKALRAGDTLVVWRLDRLGRSLTDLVNTIATLEGRGVAFESLTEKIETGSAAGRLVFHVFAALSEFERALIRERTRAGLAAARARGRRGGRPAKLSDAAKREVRVLMSDPATVPEDVMRRYGISRTTLYAYLADGRKKAIGTRPPIGGASPGKQAGER